MVKNKKLGRPKGSKNKIRSTSKSIVKKRKRALFRKRIKEVHFRETKVQKRERYIKALKKENEIYKT